MILLQETGFKFPTIFSSTCACADVFPRCWNAQTGTPVLDINPYVRSTRTYALCIDGYVRIHYLEKTDYHDCQPHECENRFCIPVGKSSFGVALTSYVGLRLGLFFNAFLIFRVARSSASYSLTASHPASLLSASLIFFWRL